MKLEADHRAVFEIGSGVLGRGVAEVASTEGAIEYVRLKNVAPAGKWSFETPTSLDWYWFNPEVGRPLQIAEVRNRTDKRFGRNLLPFTQLEGYCGSEATKCRKECNANQMSQHLAAARVFDVDQTETYRNT